MPENPNEPVTELQSVPDNLNVSLVFQALGKGVQIYVCTASTTDTTQFAWTFKAPQANLYNDRGDIVGIHYASPAGPTWQASDGSKVVGAVVAKADQDPNAIPWLLLRAISNEGSGLFSHVVYIQRLYTVGGKAPVGGCDQTNSHREVLVDYTAQYLFYGSPTEES